MDKITKKELKKLLKKTRTKKFREEVEDKVKEEAKSKLGDTDSIVIAANIEIGVVNTEDKVASGKVKSNALRRCTYICYVIGGARICREICY